MTEPFFYGPKNSLALYNPSANPDSKKLVVICPPLFDEYQRGYRALSELAHACASKINGPHVLRIDYYGTGEAAGLLKDASLDDWLSDIYNAVEEGMALTGAINVDLVGVRFGATLASQCDHDRIRHYLFWDPIDTGEEYLHWLDCVNKFTAEKHTKIAKLFNLEIENISYDCFELSQEMVGSISNLSIQDLLTTKPDKVWVTTTQEEVYRSGKYPQCVYTGYSYDWPIYHPGNLIPKAVLESIAEKILG